MQRSGRALARQSLHPSALACWSQTMPAPPIVAPPDASKAACTFHEHAALGAIQYADATLWFPMECLVMTTAFCSKDASDLLVKPCDYQQVNRSDAEFNDLTRCDVS